VQGGGAPLVCPPQAPKRGRGRPRKDGTTPAATEASLKQTTQWSTSSIDVQHDTPRPVPSPTKRTTLCGAVSTPAIEISTTPSIALLRGGPYRDYLLPPEALENTNWGCPPHAQQRHECQIKPLQPLLEEHDDEDWTLENDINVPIGSGNEDIRYLEELSDGSEGSYFSADDDDSDEYGWGEEFPDNSMQPMWPPEMLHAPATSRKRRYKRKAPLWPPLDDITCVSLAGGDGYRSEAHGGVLEMREGGMSNGEEKQGYAREAHEFERPVLAGVEVGPEWGALYSEPVLTHRSEVNIPVPQVSVSGVGGMQQGGSPTCVGGTPRTRRAGLCTAGAGYIEQEGLIPELDAADEDFFMITLRYFF
jgi:hypothetical protein